MITLNDYLYSGNTILRILQNYIDDLRKEAKNTHNEIDLAHSNFLVQILAFTFKGRIKSLIRAEEKFNGYIVEYIYHYYKKNGTYPPVSELKNRLSCFGEGPFCPTSICPDFKMI